MIGALAIGIGLLLVFFGVSLYWRHRRTASGVLLVILGVLAALSGFWSMDRLGDGGTIPSSDSPTPTLESNAESGSRFAHSIDFQERSK